MIRLMERLCAWCEADITHLKSNAVYCSNSCRTEAHRAAPCYYCGMPASEREHIKPKFVQILRNTNTVPTCYECNRIAGKKEFDTVEQKQKYIKSRIEIKYKKILQMPDWTLEEIEELGPQLKYHVLSTIQLKVWINERLEWKNH